MKDENDRFRFFFVMEYDDSIDKYMSMASIISEA